MERPLFTKASYTRYQASKRGFTEAEIKQMQASQRRHQADKRDPTYVDEMTMMCDAVRDIRLSQLAKMKQWWANAHQEYLKERYTQIMDAIRKDDYFTAAAILDFEIGAYKHSGKVPDDAFKLIWERMMREHRDTDLRKLDDEIIKIAKCKEFCSLP